LWGGSLHWLGSLFLTKEDRTFTSRRSMKTSGRTFYLRSKKIKQEVKIERKGERKERAS
jgi:hypothetical protein